MSIDRSLKVKDSLSRHRNVLSRAERLEMLKEQERWIAGGSVLGLPKVSHRKSVAGKKEKVETDVAAAPGAVAAPAAGAKAPAAGAKAPAAGAKAPAAKTEAKKK